MTESTVTGAHRIDDIDTVKYRHIRKIIGPVWIKLECKRVGGWHDTPRVVWIERYSQDGQREIDRAVCFLKDHANCK